ncbi:MAG: hypothetical protein WCE68_15220 [Anaerolineales bacterium]
MKKKLKIERWIKLFLLGGLAGLMSSLLLFSPLVGSVYAQQPTGSVATVTGTPTGPEVMVYSDQTFIEVYSGPSSYHYNPIGVLAAGTTAPALGYSLDGNWIEIVYLGVPGSVGWVYAPLVSISAGTLPQIPAPATAAPATTPTLNPTYVAAYGLQVQPTRLPTFTPPAALKIPTFTPNAGSGRKIPYGLVIVMLVLIGVVGAMVSFLRGNR